ncbi:hypothetical protein DOM22_10950 [Bdellovibrio sp. ZAP7]|uniref:RHS repeat domain-containing protein n=1 Tax=Bdellovibrio sp. ZAP7 TaxID=2231053 RepID=UPI0011627DC7|nr:RHS repeat-associated core domain-containing protein [Bdellovibrio sp. ZAP7]QDK45629.1 hypothetical protein DOM22_10950 [Bdellovibrio sp. ZAP7]
MHSCLFKAVVTSFISIFIVSIGFAEDQECETSLIAQMSSFTSFCNDVGAGHNCAISGIGGTVIKKFDFPTYIEMQCFYVLCTGEEWLQVSSPAYVTKCPSMQGVEPGTLTKNMDQPTNVCGSIINPESGVLGESVPIVDTNFSMNYFSTWVEGRYGDYMAGFRLISARLGQYNYAVPVTYDGKISMFGSVKSSASNISTDEYSYGWDGLDQNGNTTLGTVPAKVTTTFQTTSGPIEIESEITVGSLKAIYLGMGGWLPSNYYFYDIHSKSLYKGNGQTEKVKATQIPSGGYYVAIDDASSVLYFDSVGRIIEIKSGLLGATLVTYNYNSSGYLISIVEPFGKITLFNRDANGKFISITAPNGKVTTVTTDVNGYLSSITDPKNQIYSFTYYGTKGALSSFTKPGGQVSSFAYDWLGNLTQDSHSGGFFYNLFKEIDGQSNINASMSTPMSRKTNYSGSIENDGTGVVTTTYPSGSQTKTTYGLNKAIETLDRGITSAISTNPDPRFVDRSYANSVTYRDEVRGGVSYYLQKFVDLNDPSDPFSIVSYRDEIYGPNSYSLVSSFNPTTKTFTNTTGIGKVSTTTIDGYERIVSEQQGNLSPVQYGYTNEKLTTVAQGPRTTSFGYNSTTNYLESITNPLNQTTMFSYDSAGQLIGQIGPDLRSVAYTRDSNGNVTGITPFGRPVHQFTSNANELLSGYQPPSLTGVSNVNTTYTYNNDKQLTQITKPTGQTISYDYDLTTGVLAGYSTPLGSYTVERWTTSDKPKTIIMPNGSNNYIEWAGDEIVYNQYRNASYGQIYAYRKNYQYDGVLLGDVVENPSGTQSSISYTFNSDQDLTNAGDMILSYNTPNGQLTTVKMGTSSTTGFTDTYTYNTFGEVTGYTVKRGSTTIYTMTLTRDALGRIDTKTQTMNSTTDAYSYVFDLSGRLQQVTKNAAVIANYGYDSNSNRNAGNVGAQTTTASYDDQDRLTAYNSLTFTYDANGDLLTKTNNVTNTTTQYTYDVFGNLTQVVLPGGATTISYEIDVLNRRVGMKVNNILQKRWVYMDQYRIAAELNASGTITKRFVYGSKENIPDYMIASGVKYRIISDQLGSPRLVVKQSDGTITQRMNHDEFGRVTEDTNPGYLPFGFAGGLYDNQTGLVRFGARDYDPEVGRWTAKDPIDFEGEDNNLYGYVENEPVNWIDINGANRSRSLRIPDGGGGGGAPISGATPRITKIIKPDGKLIGEASKNSNLIRLLNGGKDAAVELFKRLCKGGKPLANKNGRAVVYPDGTFLQYRPVSSNKGPPTIDIHIGTQQIKLKFTDSK